MSGSSTATVVLFVILYTFFPVFWCYCFLPFLSDWMWCAKSIHKRISLLKRYKYLKQQEAQLKLTAHQPWFGSLSLLDWSTDFRPYCTWMYTVMQILKSGLIYLCKHQQTVWDLRPHSSGLVRSASCLYSTCCSSSLRRRDAPWKASLKS